jgi:hypothetical protein
MSQEERFGTRDLTYSAWHREQSTQRFVGSAGSHSLAMIDLDGVMWLEYDRGVNEPLALMELARDIGQASKAATLTQALARRCCPTLPAFVVLYRISEKPNPAAPEYPDISFFRVRRIWPNPEATWHIFSARAWAEQLLSLRTYCSQFLDANPEAANGRS